MADSETPSAPKPQTADDCGDFICEECPRFKDNSCDTVKGDAEED